MNILITEAQYNKLTEEKYKEFLYKFWNNQKKHGEKPSLDEMLYKVLGFNKNTREDYNTIRPLWYRYNGGYEKIKEKIINQINDKDFNLVDSELNIDTTIKVVGFDNYNEFLVIMVDIDPRGTIEYVGWDEEEDQEFVMNDTIRSAYQEAQSNYETGDLMGILRSSVYSFFYDLLDEYGLPIEVDIDLEEIDGAPYTLKESFHDEMKIIVTEEQLNLLSETSEHKNLIALEKYWKTELKKGNEIRFNKDELDYWGITNRSNKIQAQMIFQELVGDEEFAKKLIKKLVNKTFSTKDFSDRIVGGYDFEWVISDMEYRDFDFYLYGKTLPGGTVTMMDGRYLTLTEATEDEDIGWEIQQEVNDVVEDCMNTIILPATGYEIDIPVIYITE